MPARSEMCIRDSTPAAAAVRGERPECAVHCGVVAPPLEPERASRAGP
ncbi:hypothetical protein [Streptomyces sp. wa1063]|nr:hypothetical protein [Streptomyces sp. wa1063]